MALWRVNNYQENDGLIHMARKAYEAVLSEDKRSIVYGLWTW